MGGAINPVPRPPEKIERSLIEMQREERLSPHGRQWICGCLQPGPRLMEPSPVRVPPELTESRAPDGPIVPSTSSVPPLTAAAPVKVFEPPSTSLPLPVLVKPPGPESAPLKVILCGTSVESAP